MRAVVGRDRAVLMGEFADECKDVWRLNDLDSARREYLARDAGQVTRAERIDVVVPVVLPFVGPLRQVRHLAVGRIDDERDLRVQEGVTWEILDVLTSVRGRRIP